jgi:hypothetical protein
MDVNSTLYVDIDDQAWGVVVQTEHEVNVSVWTEEYSDIFKPRNDMSLPIFTIHQVKLNG